MTAALNRTPASTVDGAADPLEAIRARLSDALGDGIPARLLSSELAALWFATAGWRSRAGQAGRPGQAGGARAYAYGRGAGALYGAVMGAVVVETLVVHLLVSRWSEAAAWGLTALGVYTVLWILADFRATRLRPVTVDDDVLVLRTGLRWTVRIPRERVVAVRKPDWRTRFGAAEGELNVAVAGAPNVVVEVNGDVVAHGPFGTTRRARAFGVAVDEPGAFLAAFPERPE